MGLFQGKFGFVIIVIVICIVLDINKHGSFKRSKTGLFLRDSGVLHYGESAFSTFRTQCQQAYWWSKRHLPVYLTKLRQNIIPVFQAVRDICCHVLLQLWTNVTLAFQYFVDKRPVLVKWMDNMVPGLLDQIITWLKLVWSFLIDYAIQLYTLLCNYMSWTKAYTYTYTQAAI